MLRFWVFLGGELKGFYCCFVADTFNSLYDSRCEATLYYTSCNHHLLVFQHHAESVEILCDHHSREVLKSLWTAGGFRFMIVHMLVSMFDRRKEGNVLFNDALNTFYLRMEGNVLFNNTLNTFYLRLYGVGLFMVIWRRTYGKKNIQIAREETPCCHMGYSFWLAARVLLYAPSHRQDSTNHSLC